MKDLAWMWLLDVREQRVNLIRNQADKDILMIKYQKRAPQGFRFYFALSVGLFFIVGVGKLMETQIDGFLGASDSASKLASLFLILFFIMFGALVFFMIDRAYEGVISRMLGSEREK